MLRRLQTFCSVSHLGDHFASRDFLRPNKGVLGLKWHRILLKSCAWYKSLFIKFACHYGRAFSDNRHSFDKKQFRRRIKRYCSGHPTAGVISEGVDGLQRDGASAQGNEPP